MVFAPKTRSSCHLPPKTTHSYNPLNLNSSIKNCHLDWEKTPLQTNQPIKNTEKKNHRFVFTQKKPGKFHRFFFPIAFCQVWGLQWLGAQKAWCRRHQTPGHCGKLQGMRDTVAGRNAVNSPVDMVVYPSFHRGFQK